MSAITSSQQLLSSKVKSHRKPLESVPLIANALQSMTITNKTAKSRLPRRSAVQSYDKENAPMVSICKKKRVRKSSKVVHTDHRRLVLDATETVDTQSYPCPFTDAVIMAMIGSDAFTISECVDELDRQITAFDLCYKSRSHRVDKDRSIEEVRSSLLECAERFQNIDTPSSVNSQETKLSTII